MIFHGLVYGVLLATEFIFLTCSWQIRCKGKDSVPDEESVKKFCDEVASIYSIHKFQKIQFIDITFNHSFDQCSQLDCQIFYSFSC